MRLVTLVIFVQGMFVYKGSFAWKLGLVGSIFFANQASFATNSNHLYEKINNEWISLTDIRQDKQIGQFCMEDWGVYAALWFHI